MAKKDSRSFAILTKVFTDQMSKNVNISFAILTFVIIEELALEITLYGVVTQQFIQAMQFNTTMHGFSDRILFWL